MQTTMKVRDVMTTRVITITQEQSKQQAARLLTQHRISGLPVVNGGNVVGGVVTDHDVIGKEGQTVRDIMTRGVISGTPDTDLEEARWMLRNDPATRLIYLAHDPPPHSYTHHP